MQKDLGRREKLATAKGLVWYPAETDVSIRPGLFYHAKEDDQVKSPQQLLDIYFSSVGYNSVLLLNIPPNKEGLLSANDVKSLQGFSVLLKNTFAVNLAKDATINCSNGINTNALLDQSYTTYFSTKGKDTVTTIDFTLPVPKTVDVVLLQENIRVCQRVEKFVLEYKDGTAWKQLAEGSTIGYKRLIRFTPVTVKEIRLRILSSRLNPTLSSFGLYKLDR